MSDIGTVRKGNESVRNTSLPLCTMKNVMFSLLFIVPFVTVIWYGGDSISVILDANDKPNIVFIDGGSVTDEDYDGNKGARFILGSLIMILVSSLWAILLVFVTLFLGTQVIKYIFVLFILLAVFGGVILFADEDDQLFGVILMVSAVASVLYFLTIRNKLDFVGANFRVACAAVLASTTMIYLAVATSILLLVWGIFWSVVVYAVSTNDGETSMSYQGETYPYTKCTSYFVGFNALRNASAMNASLPNALSECDDMHGCWSCYYTDYFVHQGSCFTPQYSSIKVILCLLCFCYISLVLVHVVHCASAMIAATWWMKGKAKSGDILTAYQKSFSSWLGPICVGSLLVPPIRTMHSTVHTIMVVLDVDVTSGRPNKTNPSSNMIKLGENLYFVLQKLENSVISCNHFAFSYLVMQNSHCDFMKASQGVAELFSSRGFSSIVHDTVLDNILMLACTSSGILLFLLATMYVSLVEDDINGNINGMLAMCSFVMSYLTSRLLLSVIQGSTLAMYVCISENPDALQTHHPQLFEPFVSAWRKYFPEANVTISSVSYFSRGGNMFSVDVFPTPYVPPQVPFGKMKTNTSLVSQSKSRDSQRYQKISQNIESDDEEEGGFATSGLDRSPEGNLDAVLESYASNQISVGSTNVQLFSSPHKANETSNAGDEDENDIVL